jgi:hypothetical protein
MQGGESAETEASLRTLRTASTTGQHPTHTGDNPMIETILTIATYITLCAAIILAAKTIIQS